MMTDDQNHSSDLRSKFNEIKRWCEKHGIRYFETHFIYTFSLDIESDLNSISPEILDRVYTIFKKYHKYLDKILDLLTEGKEYFVKVEDDEISVRVYSGDRYHNICLGVYTPEKDLLLIYPRLIYVYYYIDVYISMDDLISALVMS